MFIDAKASKTDIWPRTSTATAPKSIDCQILILKSPTRLTAIKQKTISKIIIGMKFMRIPWKAIKNIGSKIFQSLV
jgi:hypothetical protein